MDKSGKAVRKKRPRRTFTPAFKAEAVRLCRVGDRSIAKVAKGLDLTVTALRKWVRRADTDVGKGSAGALTTGERAELARLRREIRQLQMERDILEKGGVISTFKCTSTRGLGIYCLWSLASWQGMSLGWAHPPESTMWCSCCNANVHSERSSERY